MKDQEQNIVDEVLQEQLSALEPEDRDAPQETPAKDGRQTGDPLQAHFADLQKQSAELQKKFPDFDLAKELESDVFLQLTAPGTGISVADAYYALHREEIEKAQVTEIARKIVSAIQSGSRRPLEAGTSGQGPSLTTFRYDTASKEQREAFKKELRRAWSRGEPVYPNR